MARAARLGLAARALTYLLLAWLCAEIVVGRPHHQASDTGAFELLAGHAWGVALLFLIGIGFAGYALWALSVALGGLRRWRRLPQTTNRAESRWYASEGSKVISALFRAVVYGFLSYLAFALATGTGHGSSGDPAPLAARVMQEPAGQLVVAAAGGVVIVAGLVLMWRALRRRFLDDMDTDEMTEGMRRLVSALGVTGSVARGVVVVLVGPFLLVSGVTRRPGRAKGLDASLVTLAHQPYGPVLLGAVALGLATFAAFSAFESRYIQT